MALQSDLEYEVTMALVEHYQTHSPGFINLVQQLLTKGLDPMAIEVIVGQDCPPGTGSAVAAHAYLLAVHYSSRQAVSSAYS